MPNLIRFGTGGKGASISAPILGTDFLWSSDSDTLQVIDGDPWRMKFLSSGSFTPLRDMVIDAFLVGAGGGKGYTHCGAGGSGYTTTVRSVVLAANTAYQITIGAAGTNGLTIATNGTDGGTTSAFAASAPGGKGSNAGKSSSKAVGADGGSGGGGLNVSGVHANSSTADGGIDGEDGTTATTAGGAGQGTTTREFGEADGDLYASGGGDNLTATVPNSGNGGAYNIAPADGIVVIRQHKEAAA